MAKKDHLHLTKNQVDGALSNGIKHAFMFNRGVGKRMKQMAKDHQRKQQILENKARKNAKALEAAYAANMAEQSKKLTDNAFADFEADVAKYSSDMGMSNFAPETFPVVEQPAASEFAASLDTPPKETPDEHVI